MRLIFAGTPEFARVALERLYAAGLDIALVLTQPDRPAGRGLRPQASPVKQFALSHGLAVAQPHGLRPEGRHAADAAAARAAIEAARADVMVVAAYGLLLPQWVLDAMSAPCAVERRAATRGLGCLNIHASLLPRWRGAAPIQRAIEAGDAESGVTIMQMDAGLDTGDLLLAQGLPVAPRETAGSLHKRLAALGGQLTVQALALAATGGLRPRRQPEAGVSYAHKIGKTEAAVDWAQPAEVLERRVRAFDPSPGAHTLLEGAVVKLWRCEIDSSPHPPSTPPGTILSATAEGGVCVACGEGALRLTELQRAGGRRLAVADFLRGCALRPGQRLR